MARVLHIHSGLFGGGIETFIHTVVRELAPDFESSLFTLARSVVYYGPDVPVIEATEPMDSYGRRFSQLRRHIASWKPDIIHMHFGDATMFGMLTAPVSLFDGAVRARLRRLLRRGDKQLTDAEICGLRDGWRGRAPDQFWLAGK